MVCHIEKERRISPMLKPSTWLKCVNVVRAGASVDNVLVLNELRRGSVFSN